MKKLLSVFLLLPVMYAKAQMGVGTTSPNSTFDIRGSLSTAITTFTGTTTAGTSDNMLVFTGTSATTLTLPTAVGITGREYWIKNATTNSSVLTIATTSSQTIDGLTTWPLTQANKAIRVVSNGSNWYAAVESLPGSSGTPWVLGGNNVVSLQNIGTTSNYAVPFITNNTEKMRLSAAGSLGIGTSTFNATYPERLLVDAGASGGTNYQNVIVGKGNTNSYAQLNIQNLSAGNAASSDVVATADNGDETNNYIDMGINGSANASGVMGAANDAYLYNIGQNLLVGTGSASKSLVFMTGGTSQSSNERMRIDGSGNVGIGTNSPSYKLHVNGTNPLFLNGVQTGASTDSVLMIINGVVKKIHPSALAASNNAWSILGNASTNPATNFIGTTDAQALVVKENNTQVARFEANSIALGNGSTTSNSTHSYVLGSSAVVGFNKTNSYAIGSGATVNADSSFAIGNSAVANGKNSFAIGPWASANNVNSVAIGYKAVTAYSISDAVAIGTNATANDSNSIAIGSNGTLANKTVTNAVSAIAIGNNTTSNSVNAISIGTGASTGYNLTNPITIGVNSTVGGNNGVVIGNGASIGFVANAMALGAGASATSTAANSSAIGYNASATLPNEIILGDRSSTALSVGIGTESFSGSNREKLLVDAGASGSSAYQNVIVGKGNTNSYAQLNIQNTNTGTSASSDVVATASNGDESSNFIDMGINGGGNTTTGVLGGANTAYLYSTGSDFAIGNGSNNKSLNFFTTASSVYTERMRITNTGNVGIANVAPSEKLDVTGNIRFSGALMPNNSAGTAGYFLQSQGAGAAPVWFDASNLAWQLNGNTMSSLKTIGTINAYDLPFITNNTERMRISSTGSVGIGTSTFNGTNPEELIVDAGTNGSGAFQNVIVGKGNTNSYAQLNIQNGSSGTAASSDVVATANNGNESINYIDMGINGSGNTSSGILGAANNAYLYATGNDFVIGNSTENKDLIFYTTVPTATSTERMRVTGNGVKVSGSVTVAYRSGTGAYTVLATDYVIINTGIAATWTLPAANTCAGRVYRLLNQGTANITLSQNVRTASGTTSTVLAFAAGTNFYEIMSDGTEWRRIN